ncbi:MAG TPA: hypothetical protein VFJ21_03810 [Mycobacteriales bacterium]|nr:hypothetical protein [Mycobacteriales bacterium]
MSTQAAECAAKFATRRDERIRQETNAAIARYDLAIADARHILAGTIDAEPLRQAADRLLARALIERAVLDVCRALGEA